MKYLAISAGRFQKCSDAVTFVRFMESFRFIESCRICGNTDLVPVLHLGEQSLTGVFLRGPDESVTRGPLELVNCHGDSDVCGLAQLRHTYSSSEMYGDNYGYRSSLNRSMVGHLRQKVESLRQRVELENGDIVLDIGSNDGTTLSFYPAQLERVGMDPTAARFREFYQPGIRVISDFLSAERFQHEVGNRKAKIVTHLHSKVDELRRIVDLNDDDVVLDVGSNYGTTLSFYPDDQNATQPARALARYERIGVFSYPLRACAALCPRAQLGVEKEVDVILLTRDVTTIKSAAISSPIFGQSVCSIRRAS